MMSIGCGHVALPRSTSFAACSVQSPFFLPTLFFFSTVNTLPLLRHALVDQLLNPNIHLPNSSLVTPQSPLASFFSFFSVCVAPRAFFLLSCSVFAFPADDHPFEPLTVFWLLQLPNLSHSQIVLLPLRLTLGGHTSRLFCPSPSAVVPPFF